MLATIMVVGMVSISAMALYSYFVGVSAFKLALTGTAGSFVGIFVEYFTEFTAILDAGISQFMQPGYIGPTVLVIGVGSWIFVMALNLLSTWDTDPTLLQ